jgi:hypothetical protein
MAQQKLLRKVMQMHCQTFQATNMMTVLNLEMKLLTGMGQ